MVKMNDMRQLINLVEGLYQPPIAESLDQQVDLEYQIDRSPGNNYHSMIYSDLEMPDGTMLRMQAGYKPRLGLASAPKSYWEVGFGRTESPSADLKDISSWKDELTRLGSERLAFSAVLEFLRHLVNEKKPQQIRFGTSNAGGVADKRASLYGRIAARYAPSLGYDVTTEPDPDIPGGTLFILNRK